MFGKWLSQNLPWWGPLQPKSGSEPKSNIGKYFISLNTQQGWLLSTKANRKYPITRTNYYTVWTITLRGERAGCHTPQHPPHTKTQTHPLPTPHPTSHLHPPQAQSSPVPRQHRCKLPPDRAAAKAPLPKPLHQLETLWWGQHIHFPGNRRARAHTHIHTRLHSRI